MSADKRRASYTSDAASRSCRHKDKKQQVSTSSWWASLRRLKTRSEDKQGNYLYYSVLFMLVLMLCAGWMHLRSMRVSLTESDLTPLQVIDRQLSSDTRLTAEQLDALLQAAQTIATRIDPHLDRWVTNAVASPARANSEVAKALERTPLLHNATVQLRRAADVAYGVLQSILHREPTALLSLRPFGKLSRQQRQQLACWLISTAELYGVTLPSIALLTEKAPEHATVLIRLVALLQQSVMIEEELLGQLTPTARKKAANTLLLDHRGKSYCESCGSVTARSSHAKKFCKNSMVSPNDALIRIAASLEELITLYQQYMPFRLHYITAYILRDTFVSEVREGSVAAALRLVRIVRERLRAANQNVELGILHDSLLALIEVHLVPLLSDTAAKEEAKTSRPSAAQQVRDAITRLDDCHQLVRLTRPYLQWPGKEVWHNEMRPAILTRAQLRTLIDSVRRIAPESADVLANCDV